MNIKSIIPNKLKILYTNYFIKRTYDVLFEKGATAGRNTVFEGKNCIKMKSQVYNSYLGLGTYISGNTKLHKVKIGRFCSIGQNVSNAFGIHPTDWVSTHPSFYSLQKQAGFTFTSKQRFNEHKFADAEKKYYVIIGNDVWIGNDVKLMDGIKIGDGAIIATGAIVTKNVEPYTIVGGIPAKTIRKRFCDDEIDFMLSLQWWNKELSWILDNVEKFDDIKKLKEKC